MKTIWNSIMKEQYFDYLDALRESGAINMWGAAPYLQEAFGLSRQEARVIFLEWMDTFSQRQEQKQAQ